MAGRNPAGSERKRPGGGRGSGRGRAEGIGTNHYYLSQYFSQQGLSYNTYINGLRIRHFIRLYEKAVAENRTFTAQQLATESGYRSYSTFSAAFKQYTGKTVTAWMNEAGE
ncbi:MAG: helix-turn-helix domain-containing protein [Bacteroidales bacterium]|nr:helix-turn-helix domain-containing protein [Bacteroidales bacterium]